MEITPWTIYLWQLADTLDDFLSTFAIVMLVPAAAIILLSLMAQADGAMEEKTANKARKLSFIAVACGVCLAFAATIVPSSKTIAMMVIIPKIADSKVLQQDVPDLYNAAIEALKDHLKKK